MKVLILTLALLTIATSPALAAFPQPSGKGLSDLNETLAGGPKDAILFIDTMANWLLPCRFTATGFRVVTGIARWVAPAARARAA